MGDPGPHLKHGSLGLPESTCQMAPQLPLGTAVHMHARTDYGATEQGFTSHLTQYRSLRRHSSRGEVLKPNPMKLTTQNQSDLN